MKKLVIAIMLAILFSMVSVSALSGSVNNFTEVNQYTIFDINQSLNASCSGPDIQSCTFYWDDGTQTAWKKLLETWNKTYDGGYQ